MLLIIRECDLLSLDSLDRLGRDYEGIIRECKYITRDLKQILWHLKMRHILIVGNPEVWVILEN